MFIFLLLNSILFVISTSEDQTTRVFAPWVHSDQSVTWQEISRPQIHGYNLTCITFLNKRNHTFASGAEEKVIRIFDAPQTFIDTLKNVTKNEVLDQVIHFLSFFF